jgi:hypothetical protein
MGSPHTLHLHGHSLTGSASLHSVSDPDPEAVERAKLKEKRSQKTDN